MLNITNVDIQSKHKCTYGDVKIAFEIEDAALKFDVLQVMAAFRAKEIFLHQLFKDWFVFGKLNCVKEKRICYKFINFFRVVFTSSNNNEEEEELVNFLGFFSSLSLLIPFPTSFLSFVLFSVDLLRVVFFFLLFFVVSRRGESDKGYAGDDVCRRK